MSNGERIPTMPQCEHGERIPTMPQCEHGERIPTMPQCEHGERIPTMPQCEHGERIPTMPQREHEERIPTIPQNFTDNNVINRSRIILEDVKFCEGEREYVIKANQIVSLDSGEAQIYKCYCSNLNEEYIAKILTEIGPDSPKEILYRRRKVINFLYNVSNMKKGINILPLKCSTEIEINGRRYFVDIYPYCKEGDLFTEVGKISYEKMKIIINGINNALKCIHDHGFVHRDIKPDNIYFYNGIPVIGDFGITTEVGPDNYAIDRSKIGTLGYHAPELMFGAAVKESDYYSFGQTLWTLYSGEMMYAEILNLPIDIEEKRDRIKYRMMNKIFDGIENLGKDEDFFGNLIEGLLQYDPKYRFDYIKVKRWLDGDKSVVNEIPDNIGKNIVFRTPININGEICYDNSEVANALSLNWEKSLNMLYGGKLKEFYSYQNYNIGTEISKIMRDFNISSRNQDVVERYLNKGLAILILNFSEGKYLCWKKKKIENSNDIIKYMEEDIYDIDIMDIMRSGLFYNWCSIKYKNNNELLAEIKDIISLSKMDANNDDNRKIAMHWIYYTFQTDKSKIEYMGAYNFKELSEKILSSKNALYINGGVVDDLRFMAILCKWGYLESVKIFIQNRGKDYRIRYDLFFVFLLKELKSPKEISALNRYYYYYGPQSHLTWWQRNIDIYSFSGGECSSLIKSIRNVCINENTSISEQKKALYELKVLANQFYTYIDNIMFMSELGITYMEENYIYSDRVSAYWNYEFLGQKAPIGFKMYMEL